MSCPDVLDAPDPLKAFSNALVNFHNHHCLDDHGSVWCKYHPEVHTYVIYKYIYVLRRSSDGQPYCTNKPLKCTEQSTAFLNLLKNMAGRP